MDIYKGDTKNHESTEPQGITRQVVLLHTDQKMKIPHKIYPKNIPLQNPKKLPQNSPKFRPKKPQFSPLKTAKIPNSISPSKTLYLPTFLHTPTPNRQTCRKIQYWTLFQNSSKIRHLSKIPTAFSKAIPYLFI